MIDSTTVDSTAWRDRARSALVALALTVLAWVPSLRAQTAPPPGMLDGFDQLTAWHAGASDGVTASIHAIDDVRGRALRLDFDLAGTAGYALAYRALPVELPPNYEISFYVRADAPVNTFQFKLVDASGDNVWWFNRPNYDFPRDWQLVRIKKRQIEFAWGPTQDRELKHVARLEFVVAAGRGGGRGSVYVSELRLRELPPEPASWPKPVAQASSHLAGAEPSLVLDGEPASAWKSDPVTGAMQSLTVDFGRRREFGGLILRWLDNLYASRYDVQFSDDGLQWVTVRRVVDGRGGPDALLLPDADTRYVRLALHAGPTNAYGLGEMEIKDLAFGASTNAFFAALARESPRGYYPRGFSGEQPYWTIIGIDGGSETALLSEDGALEVARGGFSIEPFVVTNSRVVTWADVDAKQSLRDDYLPIPNVTWREREWELRVSAFASGTRAQSRLIASYALTNLTDRPLSLRLVLAVRPFQVNPPSQFLSTPGGVSAIHDVRWDGTALTINDNRQVFPLRAPDRAGMFPSDAGAIPKLLAAADWGQSQKVHDDLGYASAALGYDLRLAPRASTQVAIVLPLSGTAVRPRLDGQPPQTWVAREQNAVAAMWRAKLDRVSLRAPASAKPLVDTLRTAIAHILITRDGPILRPGTRSYARSWIRDGTMIAESLLRLDHADVAVDYLRWYAPYQFASGKVPCCVDERGADPVPENDSAGEFLYLVAEIYRYTHDRALLDAMWQHVEKAAGYLDTLRQSERSAAGLAPAMRGFYGLLPASISHEGYSAKPMHAYWDDFWAWKGYDGAVRVASALGRNREATRFERERDEFGRDIAASLRHTATAHGIDFLAGAAELGDFDATSTAIAFAPGGGSQYLPSDLVGPTFERYWREFIDRRDGRKAWEEYTPYELRTVGTFVRLGARDRAQEQLAFFLAGRRPAAWNQWAEVVGREARRPRFVGDMPHGWVASDFIRATLDLFAYERDEDRAIVIGAGIPGEWLAGPGVAVKDLHTPYGRLSYSLRREGGRVVLRLPGGPTLPPGGFAFVWPGDKPPRFARINGKAVEWKGTELRIGELPATVVVDSGG